MKIEIGDMGRAVSALRPAGVAEIRGQRVDVRSDGGWIDVGCPIVVVAADPFAVIVKLAEGLAVQHLPALGEKIPTAQERETRRHLHEKSVREEDARAGSRRQNRDAALIGVLVALPAAALGYWIGDGVGVLIAIAATFVLVAVLRFALEFFS